MTGAQRSCMSNS